MTGLVTLFANHDSVLSPQARGGRLLVVGALLLALGVPLGGCRIGPRDFRNENDRLRRQNLELRREVEQLSERLALRIGELEALRQQLERAEADPMPEAERPVLSRLSMGRYSGGVDTTDDGFDNLIRVYLRPQDQQGRVMPVAGRAIIQAVAVPREDEPTILARRVYEPGEFDRAWRSGFMGSHFTLELELDPEQVPEDVSEAIVRVTFTQAGTGVELQTQEAFRIRRPMEAAEVGIGGEKYSSGGT